MIAAGILGERDRVKLVGGEVVEMSAMGARHARSVAFLDDELRAPLAGRAQTRAQLPVTIPEYNEPEPDIAVVRSREDGYVANHPGPDDVPLLIEVSDSTLEYDGGVKAPAAGAGIPEVWIVNLRGGEGAERPHLAGALTVALSGSVKDVLLRCCRAQLAVDALLGLAGDDRIP
ncbi:MAG: Uma2 family endonuclease [Chloroflexia bacterium]